MRRKFILIAVMVGWLGCWVVGAETLTAEQIVNRVNANFSTIKTAVLDFTIDYNVHLFGCSGLQRWQGKGFYKYPNKLRLDIKDGPIYFAKGNKIRKLDPDGQGFIVRFINALDFSVGFNPRLLTHNFNLKILEQTKEKAIIEGIPKPGILKNAKKLIFHINLKNNTLEQFDIIFSEKKLNGSIKIQYQKINDLMVPVGAYGKSAIQVVNNFLVGLSINMRGKNYHLNADVPDKVFESGF